MMERKRLTTAFFNRPVLEVAPELLGCYLVRKTEAGERRFLITEVEAYDGEKDLACHAAKGRTKRTEVLYGEAGTFYVYLCYGMHWLLNVVTGPSDYPAAVLIRGLERLQGPGRLTRELQITGAFHGVKDSNELYFEKGIEISKSAIQRTPRIGVAYAGKVWAKKKYRFVLRRS